jgi:hypothetical protein
MVTTIILSAVLGIPTLFVYGIVCLVAWSDGDFAAEEYRSQRRYSEVPNPKGILTAWSFARGVSAYERSADRKAKHILANLRKA